MIVLKLQKSDQPMNGRREVGRYDAAAKPER